MILITGVAGFIGYHTASNLLDKNVKIIGIDNLNNYYDIKLKKDRLKELKKKYKKNFIFLKLDITNKQRLKNLFKKFKIETVINLAAQAGVRYSIYKPSVYLETNINGFFNILDVSKIIKLNILFLHLAVLFMEIKKNIPLKRVMKLANLYHSMPQLKKQMKY